MNTFAHMWGFFFSFPSEIDFANMLRLSLLSFYFNSWNYEFNRYLIWYFIVQTYVI